MLQNKLKNKTILVAGASGGIGSALVKKITSSNVNVVAAYNKNIPDFQTTQNLSTISADLSEPEEWDRVLQYAIEKHSKLDVLVNCIGFLIPGNLINQTENQIAEIIKINFTSSIIGTQKSLLIFRRQGSGHTINTGSLGGVIPMPYCSVYSATKFALRGFTHSLAQELKGTGVNISLVSPGPVNTKMLQQEAGYYKAAIAFVNKAILPEQIADTIIEVINKPKTEVIIPSSLSFTSRAMFLFPELFSRSYKLLEKIGRQRKEMYLKKQPDF
jgi:short-subunit dehydrogenase